MEDSFLSLFVWKSMIYLILKEAYPRIIHVKFYCNWLSGTGGGGGGGLSFEVSCMQTDDSQKSRLKAIFDLRSSEVIMMK